MSCFRRLVGRCGDLILGVIALCNWHYVEDQSIGLLVAKCRGEGRCGARRSAPLPTLQADSSRSEPALLERLDPDNGGMVVVAGPEGHRRGRIVNEDTTNVG